jgi:hypothetical protein
MAKIGWE